MAPDPPTGEGYDRTVSLTENSSDASAEPTAAMTPARDGEEKLHRAASIFGSFGHFDSPSAVTPSAVLAELEREAPSKSAIATELARRARELTEEQMAEFKECFSLFDDGSGTVDTSELGEVMRSLGRETSDAELARIIEQVGADGSGTVDFAEFLGMMATQMRDHDADVALKRAFDLFATAPSDAGAARVPVGALEIVFAAPRDGASEGEIERLAAEAACGARDVTVPKFSSLFDSAAGEDAARDAGRGERRQPTRARRREKALCRVKTVTNNLVDASLARLND